MAFEAFALPGPTPIDRWDMIAVTEGSGLGVADRATITGSDPGWFDDLTTRYQEVYFVEGAVTYGPYDIIDVADRGEAGVWTATLIENYYWEQRVAALPLTEEGAIQAIFDAALQSEYSGFQPWAGWQGERLDLIASFIGADVERATAWNELVAAAERWGLTAYAERSPGATPMVRVIPRYPVDGGPTGRRVEVPWPEWNVASRERKLLDRANPVGGWRDRRITSSSRTFLDLEEIVELDVGSREPALFLDLQEAGLAKVAEELERWRQQNECVSLKLEFPLQPDQHMGQVRSHDIVRIADLEDEWRVVSVEGKQEGTRRTATLQLMLWQGFFERLAEGDAAIPVAPTPVAPAGDRTSRTLRGLAVLTSAGPGVLLLVVQPDFAGGEPAAALSVTLTYPDGGVDTANVRQGAGYSAQLAARTSGNGIRISLTATAEGYQGEITGEFILDIL